MSTKIQVLPPMEQREDEIAAHHPMFTEIRNIPGLMPPETATLEAPVPDKILLGSLRDGRLRVRSPITVKLVTEGEHIIAEAVEFNEFGFGRNFSETLADLQRAIAELFFTLEKERECLGPELQKVWASLQNKIYKR